MLLGNIPINFQLSAVQGTLADFKVTVTVTQRLVKLLSSVK
jgi:hypothetical protein